MNFDQFAAGFQSPQESRLCGETLMSDTQGQAPAGEVVLAGTLISANKDLACVDINGSQYEIKGGDVIDITDFAAALAAQQQAEGKPQAEPGPPQAGQLVLIRLQGNAILYCRMSVPAVLVAATGTWLGLVPTPGAQAEPGGQPQAAAQPGAGGQPQAAPSGAQPQGGPAKSQRPGDKK